MLCRATHIQMLMNDSGDHLNAAHNILVILVVVVVVVISTQCSGFGL